MTTKSPVSGSTSTRAERAAPGSFLYAESSASSSAAMSFSGEMPFSAARAVMASRMSRDMRLLLLGLDEVGSGDGVVREGDDARACSDRHLRLGGAHELAGERLVAVVLLASANASAPTNEPPEV